MNNIVLHSNCAVMIFIKGQPFHHYDSILHINEVSCSAISNVLFDFILGLNC